ncbi:MAG TPA: hypothetical protein ENL07_10235, partial [Chlorobaculum parvum]|nr:hypothetical protein [Chlorobaculum parvum]
CVSESGTGVEAFSHEQLTPELLVKQAEAKYGEYLPANEGDRVAATNKTAEYLRELPGVKEVTVRGSDTLFVIMEDGKELLLILGKNRL